MLFRQWNAIAVVPAETREQSGLRGVAWPVS